MNIKCAVIILLLASTVLAQADIVSNRVDQAREHYKATMEQARADMKGGRSLEAKKTLLLNHIDHLIKAIERTHGLLKNSPKISQETKDKFLTSLAEAPREYETELKPLIQTIESQEDFLAMLGEVKEATISLRLFIQLIREGLLDEFISQQQQQAIEEEQRTRESDPRIEPLPLEERRRRAQSPEELG